jgi:hypothetical protein
MDPVYLLDESRHKICLGHGGEIEKHDDGWAGE